MSKTPEENLKLHKRHNIEINNPEVKKYLIDFYTSLQEETKVLLPKVIKRYEITEMYGKKVPNELAEGLKYDNLDTLHAIELILASENIDWDNELKADESHWLQEMNMLQVVLRSMEKQARTRYSTNLMNLIVHEEDIAIKFPSLERIKPYIEEVEDVALEIALAKGHDILEPHLQYARNRPRVSSKEGSNKAAESLGGFAIQFGSEFYGGSIEIATDSLAVICATLGIDSEMLGDTETAEDLLNLIYSKGGLIHVIDLGPGNGAVLAVQVGWKYFVAQPMGIMAQSLREAIFERNPLGAIGIWAAGSAPFVAGNAIKEGIFTIGRQAKDGSIVKDPLLAIRKGFIGGLKGLKYPYKAPTMATKFAFDSAMKAREFSQKPGMIGRRSINWTKDIFKFRFGQNAENMMLCGAKFYDYQSKMTGIQKMKFWEIHKALKEEGFSILRRITADYNERMAKKYIEIYARQHNKFFGIPEGSRLDPSDMKGAIESYERSLDFFQNASKQNDFLDDILHIINNKGKEVSIVGEVEDYLKNLGLGRNEAKGLASKLKTEASAKQLILEIQESAARISRQKRGVFSTIKDGLGKLKEFASGAESSTLPKKLPSGEYEYKGDRYRIPDQEVDDLIAAEKANGNKISKKEALQRLCEERSAVPRKMKSIPEGRVFRYKGETILIREGELARFDSEADRIALLEKKYQAGEFMENADEFFHESTGTRPTSSPATDTTPSTSKGKGPVLDSTPPKVETVSDAGKTASNAPEGTVKPSTEAVPERPQLVSQTEVDEALKQGRTEIDELEKAVKRAQRDVTLEKRTSGNVEAAERILEQTKKAKKATEDSVRQLERMRDLAQKYRGTEDAAEQARLVSEFEDTAKSLRKSTEAAAEASGSIGRLSRLSQTLRALGVGLSIGGTAFSGYMAIDSFYTAATVDTAERSRIEALRGGMWTVDTAAGGVLTAGMMGYAGTGATKVAGRASAVLVPLTFAAENVFDTLSEDAMTEAEWAQSHSVNDLYHQWFSGISSISLGDAWVASVSNLEKAKDRRTKTLHEIYRVLIATERNPEILRYIQSTPPSQEKNDKIHQKIDAEYSKYHEYYFRQYPEKFRHGSSESIETYQEARQWIVDAELFHDLMTLREKKKGEGVSIYMIGNYNLMDSRFEIKGEVNHPNGHFYEPHLLVEAYKKGIVEEIESLDPMLSVNLHKMETHYLLSLCFQIDKTLATPSNREQFARNPQFEPELKKMQQIIKDYLICERNINYEIAVRSHPEFADLPSSPESIRARLTELQNPITDEYDEYSETVSQNNPETHAMFELAEYFGYTGPKKEDALRDFFSEGTASYHGLYYRNRGGMRGPGWYLQERGMSYDDFMGEEITPQLVSNVIRRLRENAGNIFEHRRDSMLWSAKWYHKQCFEMANKLELGYQMGEINYGELPEQFKDWEVKDVAKKGEEKPDPKPEYARVIDDIKQKQNWPKLSYEVKNDNTIKLSRTDSQEAVTLKKEGEYDASWTIDGLKNNLHLAQAVTLGNLLNHIKGIVSRSSYKARSAEPFYIGSTVWGEENIYFDNGVLNDLKLMDVSEGNLDWYNKIGITKEAIVDICNQWFKNRNAAPTTHPVSSGDRQS